MNSGWIVFWVAVFLLAVMPGAVLAAGSIVLVMALLIGASISAIAVCGFTGDLIKDLRKAWKDN